MPSDKKTVKTYLSPGQLKAIKAACIIADESQADALRQALAVWVRKQGVHWPDDEIKHGDPSRFPHVTPEH